MVRGILVWRAKCDYAGFVQVAENDKKGMRLPGIGPGLRAWEAHVIATRP